MGKVIPFPRNRTAAQLQRELERAIARRDAHAAKAKRSPYLLKDGSWNADMDRFEQQHRHAFRAWVDARFGPTGQTGGVADGH